MKPSQSCVRNTDNIETQINRGGSNMSDMSCLAEGYVVPADFEKTGVNLNEIIVGPTGCGKTMSTAYPRLVHTNNSSVVVPIAKKAIKDKFARMFEERGYKVITLDFANPDNCNIGYDPLDYVHTDEEIVQTARNLVGGESKSRNGESDPYWNESAISILAAEITLVRLNAMAAGKKACFADVITLHRTLKVNSDRNVIKTNLDALFEEAGTRYPGNQATELWKTIQDLAPRTASCILSIVNTSIDKIFSQNVIEISKKEERIDFRALGEEKTALFIITSPMNMTLQNLVNLMYADMFKELFNAAEKSERGRLDTPVHIICDDFACGSRIRNFEDYISIFRAAGISVTILLQSETQLACMYGDAEAKTIINNCDTYVYMGGMDIDTCYNISRRINKPLDTVLSMPLEQVIVFRRGSKPVVSRRYQILDDPEYQGRG